MTVLLSISALVVPWVVSLITGLLKRIPTFAELSDESRKPTVRFIAAVLALVIVVAGEWLTGTLDPTSIGNAVQTVFLTFTVWLTSLGIYHSTK